MGTKSGITWTDATWNPWQGCTPVSEGCANCYMARDKRRYGQDPWKVKRSASRTFNMPKSEKRVPPGSIVFVCSWSDFFHEDVDDHWMEEAFNIMEDRPDVDFLLLTKRVDRMEQAIRNGTQFGYVRRLPHVWLGVTAENQERANERIPTLLEIDWPGKRFVSIEPMLGPVDLTNIVVPRAKVCLTDHGYIDYHFNALQHDEDQYHESPRKLDWVIAGAESVAPGASPRMTHMDWVRGLRDQCECADVMFHLKQMWIGGGLTKEPELDGKRHTAMPRRAWAQDGASPSEMDSTAI